LVGLRSVRILGIDTATEYASIGLREDEQILAEHTERTHGSHAVSLLPLIDRVLNDARVTIDDIDTIAVSHGPGSFTGLRIGVSVAKGLACATGARIVGVSTLEALAHSVSQRTTICSLLDARRGDVYAAWFEGGTSGLRRLSADAVMSHATLLEVSADAVRDRRGCRTCVRRHSAVAFRGGDRAAFFGGVRTARGRGRDAWPDGFAQRRDE
jgi:tRNA threonylcarbamoyladenosine biosynthesis protein TsaB